MRRRVFSRFRHITRSFLGGLAILRSNEKWCGMMAAIIVCLGFVDAARADWPEQDKLLATDTAANDRFGSSVSINGGYVIVGVPLDDDNGKDSGSAYIFKHTGTSWAQQSKLMASDSNIGDFFGISASISGDYVIVGASGDDDKGLVDIGSAYIFKRSDLPDDPNWYQQAKLTASDGAADDRFGAGSGVAIDGDYAIVGAWRGDGNEPNSGSAYIFKRDPNNGAWSEQAKLTASDGVAEDRFGLSVSISGEYAIVGAMFNDANGLTDSGSAYIFKRDGTNWIQQPKLTASDGAAYDRFGLWVSISGDYSIVGAPLDDDNGENSGSAYIFKRGDDSNDPNWIKQTKLLPSDGAADDIFGWSVSISPNYAIVGGWGDKDNGSNSGSAYIFRRSEDINNPNWYEQAKLLASDGEAGDWFGSSVSISSDYAIVGAHRKAGSTGSAYVFKRVCPTADLSGDCWVDFLDYSVFADQWREPPGDPSADIDLGGGEGVVDFRDLAVMVGRWLQGN